MGAALIVDLGSVENPSTKVEPVIAGSGSTFTVRNAAISSLVKLLDVWRQGATAGVVQITSPNVVPISHGIQLACPTGALPGLLPGPPWQELVPQDILSVAGSGEASGFDVIALQSYYQELPGSSMQLKMPADIAGQTEFVFGWEVATTSSATEGAQTSTVVTTTYDGSTANRWYAVMGYLLDKEVSAVGIKGVDTSNLFVGGPGTLRAEVTRNYFADLSVRTGLPCIPLWNAANKSNTNVVTAGATASIASNVTLLLAQLNANYQP